mgnify:FL=1
MKTILGFVSFLIFILTSSAVKAECIRCLNDGGSDLVCENDAVFDLIKKCGEPDYTVKASDKTGGVFQSKTKKYGPNLKTTGSFAAVTESVDKWFYNCGQGSFDKIIEVSGGKVISIKNSTSHGAGKQKCF